MDTHSLPCPECRESRCTCTPGGRNVKSPFNRREPRNFLEMIPVRNVIEFTHEGEKITLHVPKFKSGWMMKWLIPRRKSTHFRIHLDETGSKVWKLIDGVRDTGEICRKMSELVPEGTGKEDIERRVTEFLRQLFKNRFIQFRDGL